VYLVGEAGCVTRGRRTVAQKDVPPGVLDKSLSSIVGFVVDGLAKLRDFWAVRADATVAPVTVFSQPRRVGAEWRLEAALH
jgi:hypothetical protein